MSAIVIRNRRGRCLRALVDAEDYERLTTRSWSLGTKGYPQRAGVVNGKRTTVLLHREVLRLKHGDPVEVDHINRDKLDNRRVNLRRATRAENAQNLPALANTSSSYRGVYWSPRRRRWRAAVQIARRKYYLGEFTSEQEAGVAAARFRAEHMPFSEEALAA